MTMGEKSSETVIPIKPEDVPKDLICAICLEVPSTPVVTNCNHVFCKNCILESHERQKGTKTCPVCRCESEKVQALEIGSPLAHRIWSCIAVKCEHHSEGCCWTGSIGDYASHKKTCPHAGPSLRLQIEQLNKTIVDLVKEREDWKRRFLEACESPVSNGRGGIAFEV